MSKILTADDIGTAILNGLGLKDMHVVSAVLSVRAGQMPTIAIERYIDGQALDIETLELTFKQLQLVPVECKSGPEALI